MRLAYGLFQLTHMLVATHAGNDSRAEVSNGGHREGKKLLQLVLTTLPPG